jgi:hypothetical protein
LSFVGVRVQGGLLPSELLSRLSTGRDVDGLGSADFHLAAAETVREAANRVWAYLRGAWASYQEALAKLPEGDRATSLTRERWLLVMLDQLGYGRVPTTHAGGIELEGKSFPVSHVWGPVPIHLLGARIDLDRRTPGVAGAAGASPQSMVQELLNRTDTHLWALLSNGRVLRLLRDSTSLVGSAYVEFDLEAIFEGELFSDFLLLFTLCHQSRVEVRDAEQRPSSCWLEVWRDTALETGTRALTQIRDGVVVALETLGNGFLAHPGNAGLRSRLDAGALTVEDVNHALLRVVYRLLFTFVAEDRGVLLDPDASPDAVRRYHEYFSTDRLRRTSRRRRGGRHGDKWQALCLVWAGMGAPSGRPELGLPGIGGLFEPGELDVLQSCELSNEALQASVRALSVIRESGSGFSRVVDHRNLGAEELGSIYESLLEYVPLWDPATKQYSLGMAAGNTRKTSGSYYTPSSLIESLLDTALDPVLDEAEKNVDDPEAALLSVTVCDPACGSGHFLVGAARRISKRVAGIRTGDPEPPPEAVRSAMRDVVARCIYGVDMNPLAAELAKVSLWLEAVEPGVPLAFLDAQIKVGNALIGTTPVLLADGIPDEAFKPIDGDNKTFARRIAKLNKEQRAGQGTLGGIEVDVDNRKLAERADQVIEAAGLSLIDIHVQQQRLSAYVDSDDYRRAREVADAWCAAFVWRKSPEAPLPVTHQTLLDLAGQPDLVPDSTRDEIARLTGEYRFFHWHLEFPHIFPTSSLDSESRNQHTGWYGGFDVILGNPPWEHVELKEQEFFEVRDPETAALSGAKRKKRIADLICSGSPVGRAYLDAKRFLDGFRHFAVGSGRYPLCGRGRIKTDPIFAEGARNLISGRGRFGMILPTGIATDATTQYFFRNLVETGALASLYDFENRKPLFEGVDSRFKFALLTLAGRDVREPAADFAFFAHDPTDLQRPNGRFALTPAEIKLLNPNTGTCPVFRSRRDAEITLGIYRRVPVLINERDPVNGNPWGIKFMQGLFNMTGDSHLFHTRDELEADGWTLDGNVFEEGTRRMLPLYEAKMIHHYDHRWATYERDGTVRDVTLEEKQDPNFVAMPRYWVSEREVDAQLLHRWLQPWLLGWRRIGRSTDERTVIASRIPRYPVPDKFALLLPSADPSGLQGALTSFVLDFVGRQKGGGMQLDMFLVKQLPVPSPPAFDQPPQWNAVSSLAEWTGKREAMLNSGTWNVGERALVRAELDAAFFHLYGIERDDVDYIMETFPIVKRKDIAAHGEYRTKRLIVEIYDQMADAIRTGIPYRSPFDGHEGEL